MCNVLHGTIGTILESSCKIIFLVLHIYSKLPYLHQNSHLAFTWSAWRPSAVIVVLKWPTIKAQWAQMPKWGTGASVLNFDWSPQTNKSGPSLWEVYELPWFCIFETASFVFKVAESMVVKSLLFLSERFHQRQIKSHSWKCVKNTSICKIKSLNVLFCKNVFY